MSASTDLDRQVTDWLHSQATSSGADRVLAGVLVRTTTVAQERPGLGGRVDGMPDGLKVAIAAAGLVVALAGLNQLASDGGLGASDATASPSSTPAPTSTQTAASDADGRLVPDRNGELPAGRGYLYLDGRRVSLDLPGGWEGFGGEYKNYISKSVHGPQGAEAKIFWSRYPASGVAAFECHYLRSRSVKATLSDLAGAVATVPGTDLLAGPTDMTLGGFPAKHVVFVVRDDVGCDPGFFFTYPNGWGGALWPETVPGDTIRVWIVEEQGDLFFIEGATKENAGAALEEQVERIVESIVFE
jgi:hypothetical protein